MCKQGYCATFFGTHAIFIRVVPKVFGSVNRPLNANACDSENGSNFIFLKNQGDILPGVEH